MAPAPGHVGDHVTKTEAIRVLPWDFFPTVTTSGCLFPSGTGKAAEAVVLVKYGKEQNQHSEQMCEARGTAYWGVPEAPPARSHPWPSWLWLLGSITSPLRV